MKNKREEELKQKEFENDIVRDLRNQELDKEWEDNLNKDYNPIVLGIFNFVINLLVGYILYRIVFFLFFWFGGSVVSMMAPSVLLWMKTVFQLVIVAFAIIAVITKKSPWERFIR